MTQRPLVSSRRPAYLQDLPPSGGFPRFEQSRKFFLRGPSAALLLGLGTAGFAAGCYGLAKSSIRKQRGAYILRQADRDIVAPLQAEVDLRYLEDQKAFKEWAAEVMKDKPGWSVDKLNPYKTRDFVRYIYKSKILFLC